MTKGVGIDCHQPGSPAPNFVIFLQKRKPGDAKVSILCASLEKKTTIAN